MNQFVHQQDNKKARRFRRFYEFYDSVKKRVLSYFRSTKIHILSGPPFVANTMHVGTAYNQLLKNFYQVSEQLLYGTKLRIYRGWDMHGLPIDNKIKEILNYGHEDVLANSPYYKKRAIQYINKCSTQMLKQHELLKLYEPFTEDNTYSTQSKKHYELVWSVYGQLKKYNLIYQNLKIMPYCVKCSATLANIEVQKRKASLWQWYYRFKTNELQNTFILFWTTTPWTILGTSAIAYNPNEKYGRWLQVKTNEIYLMCHILPVHLNPQQYVLIELVDNNVLKTLSYNFNDSCYKLYPADWVVQSSDSVVQYNSSTGFVNIAPLHCENDLQFAFTNSLNIRELVDDKGVYQYGPLKGYSLKNFEMIKQTLKKDIVMELKVYKDKNVCYRCKQILIEYARNEYFLKITPLVKRAIVQYAQLMKWNELSYKTEFIKWINNAKDWCISRDRTFGIPIPQFGVKTITTFEQLNLNDVDELNSTLPQLNHCKKVFDCWFQSGCASLIYPGVSKYFIEGVDQIKGWLYTSAVLSMYITSKMPFYNVHFHGFLLENKTDKLSKSRLGADYNFSTHFESLIKTYCLESVKLYFYTLPDSFSTIYNESNIVVAHKRWRIIENVVKYFSDVPSSSSTQLDDTLLFVSICRHLIYELDELKKNCSAHIEALEIKGYTDTLTKFLIEDVSRTYLKIIKMYHEKTPIHIKRYYFEQILLRINCLLQPYTVKELSNIVVYPSYKPMTKVYEFVYLLRNIGLRMLFVYHPIDMNKIKTGYYKILKRRSRAQIPLKTTIIESAFYYANYNSYETTILCDLGNILIEGDYTKETAKINSACRYIHAAVNRRKKSTNVVKIRLYIEKYCQKHSLDEQTLKEKIIENLKDSLQISFVSSTSDLENIFDEIHLGIN